MKNKKIKAAIGSQGGKILAFLFEDNTGVAYYHEQDCCEYVTIEDLDGDLQDLVGYELLSIDVRTNSGYNEFVEGRHCDESCTWTFYTFRTVNQSITVRWFGSSNGYYSEGVSEVFFNEKGEKQIPEGRRYMYYDFPEKEIVNFIKSNQ